MILRIPILVHGAVTGFTMTPMALKITLNVFFFFFFFFYHTETNYKGNRTENYADLFLMSFMSFKDTEITLVFIEKKQCFNSFLLLMGFSV